MSPSNNTRNTGRQPETPQRVANAAEQMRNTAAHGNFRGYVPQQTGSQQPMGRNAPMQPGNRAAGYGNPMYMQQTQPPAYHAVPQAAGGQRGFGMPAVQQKPKKKHRVWLYLLLAVMIIGIIAGGTWYGIKLSREAEARKIISDKVTPYDNLYCPGVYVDGIHLGGMTPEQAMNSVQSQINQSHTAWSVQLTYQGTVVANIDSALLNMNVDQNELNSLMNEAWKQGHDGTQEERYRQMEALEKTPYTAYTAKPSSDTSQIDSLLASLKQQIDVQAQDAQVLAFDVTRAYPFVFSQEVIGLNLDTGPLKTQLYQMVSTMTSGTIELVPETVQPQITQAELEKHFTLRGSATTPIDRHSTEDRNNNIRRCFQLISGTVLEDGKTFSFNGVVGERSLSNGFYPAIEYINDEHVVGVGGGACQASTTLYQAAVCAGMQITSRRPHSDSVSYAEYGTDATVYWMKGGKQIDMSFKNTSGGTIYIVAQVMTDPSNKSREICKVNIYGEDLGNTVYRLETETVEILPSILEPVYVKDKANASKAKDGCIVNSYRATYTGGVLTDRTLLFTDTYNPKPEKIYDPSLAGE